jgi:hypothetical protein
VPADSLGINTHFAGNDNLWTISAEQRRAHIAAVADQGIRIARIGPWWGDRRTRTR